MEFRKQQAILARVDLIPFFLKTAFQQTDQRFYMVLAGSGMGKTTFMINLFQQYVNQWMGKPYPIVLIPLGYPNSLARIKKLPNKENTILLLDAFDEDTQAINKDTQKTNTPYTPAVNQHEKRLQAILTEVMDCRIVIISCRTQFFANEKAEPYELQIRKSGGHGGFHTFKKIYVAPFSDKNVRDYLNQKFSRWKLWNIKKRQKAFQIVNKSPNLSVRPMLLSYIDDLLKTNSPYEFTYEIYAELIAKWIAREIGKQPFDQRFSANNLYDFSRAVALDIYKKRRKRSGLVIDRESIMSLAEAYKIPIATWQLTGNSLLNRNARGQWKFAHKSILEYFLAKEIIDNKVFANEFDFERMEAACSFYLELFKHSPQKELYLYNSQIADIVWLKELENLTTLDLSHNQIIDISCLKELKNLITLSLGGNQVTNISCLQRLKNLTTLSLWSNQVTNISCLQGLKNLITLKLSHNQIIDISCLQELKNLTTLDLSHNQIIDIGCLQRLKNLTTLELSHNQIIDISCLQGLKKLKNLNLYSNKIKDISLLKELSKLTELTLHNNQIGDISSLKELKNLTTLYLSINSIADISFLKELSSLTMLNLAFNEINDVSCLKELKNLTTLDLSYNKINDITYLQELKNLTTLNLEENQISKKQQEELQQALPNCHIRF